MNENQDENSAAPESEARPFRPPSITRQFLRGLALGFLLYLLWLMIQLFL